MRFFRPCLYGVVSLLPGFFFGEQAVFGQEDDLLASLNPLMEIEPSFPFDRMASPHDGFRADLLITADEWDFNPWNTKVFDPYKDETLEYPFQITFREDTYGSPVDGRLVVTSRYGWRNGEIHRGIDIDLENGDDVRSMLDGKVRFVSYHPGHGKTVIIRHKNGLETVYAHLSKHLVKENEIVDKGQVIGKGGTTGNARGSHLHLEVRYLGRTINPEYFFEFEPGSQIRALSLWVTTEKADPRQYSSVRKKELPIIRELAEPEIDLVVVDRNELSEPASMASAEMVASVIHLDEPETGNTSTSNAAESLLDEDVYTDVYTIRYGDTIYSLARKYQVSIDDLCRVNGIENSFKIKVGQKIKVLF